MKKKHSPLTEHYLVPAVLFLLNICLAHLLYVLEAGSMYSTINKGVLLVAFVLLGGSLFFKKQILLTGAILFYTLILLTLVIPGF